MKLITAVIQPRALDSVKKALAEVGVKGMTIYDAKGHGTQLGKVEIYRAQEVHVEFLSKIVIDIVILDEDVDVVLDAIQRAACSGSMGDGKIWVTAIERLIRVRTGETGEQAV